MQSNNTLSNKVIKGTSWLFAFQILDNIIGIIRLIIIARLLSPSDFGLIGIAMLLLQILNTFSQTGIQQYIIHKNDYEKYLNIGWTYLALRSILLFIILYISAPFIGQFFNNSSATDVIRVVGVTLLIDGFSNIGVILFQKQMTFQKQFTYQFLGSLTDFIVSLTLAILFHNVWALVAGMIANSAMRFMLSYLLSNYRPQFEINFKLFKGMNQYGKWIFGSNILQFMYSQGDDILVGRLLGTVSLGYYQLAYRISNLPTTQITWLISTVMFPVYSKIQNDRERIAKIYPSVLQIITYLSFFIGALIILFANDFTVLFLGDKWLPIVPAMQILTIWGIIRSIGATTGPVWQALGTPKIVTQIQMTQVIILILIVYPLTVTYNIVGTAIAVVLSSLISIIIAIILIIKTLKLRSNNFFEDLIYPLLSSICMALIYYLFKLNIFFNINFLNFVTLSLICIIAYLLTTIILSKFLNYRIYKNLFMIIRNMNMPIAINNKLSWLESIIT